MTNIIVVVISIVILTGLVSLIIGNEQAGWDGAVWRDSGQTTR